MHLSIGSDLWGGIKRANRPMRSRDITKHKITTHKVQHVVCNAEHRWYYTRENRADYITTSGEEVMFYVAFMC